jgi:hypothetical protein
MSIELILATFHDPSGEARDSAPLRLLADAVRDTLRRAKQTDVDVEESEGHILVDLPGGTAHIGADHAIFPIDELDPLTLRVVFAVAKAGDMAIVTEGGDYSAIVMNAAQRARLPEEEWRARTASPICRSVKGLARLLESWYSIHADFRNRAVTDAITMCESSPPVTRGTITADGDWTAKRESNAPVQTLSDHVTPPAGGISFRWDPWVGDHVADGPEPEWVTFCRFDPETYGVGAHPDVLRELKDICERHLQGKKEQSSRLIDDREWPPLELRLRFYSADIWPDRIIFRFYELNNSLAAFMLELARAADMSILVPEGVILTDAGQAARVPRPWQRTKRIISCLSAAELKSLLVTMQIGSSGKDRDVQSDDPLELFPGAYPQRARVVYMEVKPEETPVKHQKRVYKHRPQTPDAPDRPRSGLLMAEFWQLETPAGQRFLAYHFSGVGWMDLLRDFARCEDRAIGFIVNFETFVQDDGCRFPVGDCDIRKVAPT